MQILLPRVARKIDGLLTLLDVLVLVEGLQLVVLGDPAEGVDEVGAEVRVDVGGAELGRALPVHGPVGVVAHHARPVVLLACNVYIAKVMYCQIRILIGGVAAF